MNILSFLRSSWYLSGVFILVVVVLVLVYVVARVTKDLLYSLYVASPTNLLIMRRAYGREADDLNDVVALARCWGLLNALPKSRLHLLPHTHEGRRLLIKLRR